MIRREARLRREYIYRKSVEEKQRAIEEKRQRVKAAIDDNKAIPTELRDEAIDLLKDTKWGGQINEVDDEYRWAGTKDPKVVITTSRDPSSKLKAFAKEMRLVFPNAQRMNRGNYDLKMLVQSCRGNDVTDFVVLNETRGVPDGITVCHLPFGPTAFFTIQNVVMRHDIPDSGHMSEQFPHLIFNNLNSKVGQRLTSVLKHLFPVPKPGSSRIMTFDNQEDFISFRHHTWKKGEGGDIELTEVGPRFELKPYKILRGTLDNLGAAETEWALRPYMNSAGKKQQLSTGPVDLGDE
ncbi:hypothetical protein L596_018561 [Steinernema carpocapsae]|uniref:Brix domain-containing protein n=1 Tax=Steinernema carpocapsae TaxID=34508 RepID=A0A4U5N4Z8_STECR|nr:hypothetical protein L596_018561 [Steinernema carpocapsae]